MSIINAIQVSVKRGDLRKIDFSEWTHLYSNVTIHKYWKIVLFFYIHTKYPELENLSILLEKPVLFIVSVYRDVISTGLWLKVEKLPIREYLEILPMKCIQDTLDDTKFRLYNPKTGEMIIRQGKSFEIITGEKTHVSSTIPDTEIRRRKDIGPQ